jgi:endonuclease-3
MDKKDSIHHFIQTLGKHFSSERKTTLNRLREERDPFKVLIACLVSINIKDEVTEKIAEALFKKAGNFHELLAIETRELEDMLYLARYRKVKARVLQSVSQEIIERFKGNVPQTKEELLSIKGIGPKTANVILNFAFGKSYIPVDSNTLRIANRLGWIQTDKHAEVESLLIENLADEHFKDANALFMLHGKYICVPVSPFCSRCPVADICEKRGVEKSR